MNITEKTIEEMEASAKTQMEKWGPECMGSVSAPMLLAVLELAKIGLRMKLAGQPGTDIK